MSKRVYQDLAAEREATEIGKKFMNSTDVVGDMSRAYHTDLSSVRIHADSDSDYKTAQRGVDAFSTGTDVFFARAAFNKNDPASRGLLAHELSHSLQQGVGGEMGGMAHSAPMGAEQGGLIDWFRKLFQKREKKEDTVSFLEKGERRPEINGRGMNAQEIHAYANNDSNVNSHKKLMLHMSKDEQGQYADGYTDKRDNLFKFLEDRYKGKEEEKLFTTPLKNASGSIHIRGLNPNRMVGTMQSSAGGLMSNEEIGQLYDNLLSGGEAALANTRLMEDAEKDAEYKRLTGKDRVLPPMMQAGREEARKIASRYSADDIKARDAKFMVGIQQLKGMYLQQLRRIKAKYGTYLTQMHPEDFLSKAGMSFYDDFALSQDMEQLIENDKNGLIFDYENNAEDREFKLLAKYYFDAFNVISSYCGAMQVMDSPGFQPEFMEENMQSSEIYAQNAMEREGQIDGPGFSREEYAAYVNRVKKRFKWGKKNKAKLFGRFK